MFNEYENYFYSSNPPEFKRNAWYGLVFRWYGVDNLGNIAIFETGELPIPSKIFKDELAYRELDIFFRELPSITTAEVADTKANKLKTALGNPVDYSNYLQEANKGLYFIDEVDSFLETKKQFGYIEREEIYGYYLIAIPNKKLNVSELPERIKLLLEPYHLPINFSEIEKIDVTRYLICN